MKNVHYRRERGYRRNPGLHGRPVYYVQMTPEEVAGRRALLAVIGTLAGLVGGVVLWLVTL